MLAGSELILTSQPGPEPIPASYYNAAKPSKICLD